METDPGQEPQTPEFFDFDMYIDSIESPDIKKPIIIDTIKETSSLNIEPPEGTLIPYKVPPRPKSVSYKTDFMTGLSICDIEIKNQDINQDINQDMDLQQNIGDELDIIFWFDEFNKLNDIKDDIILYDNQDSKLFNNVEIDF